MLDLSRSLINYFHNQSQLCKNYADFIIIIMDLKLISAHTHKEKKYFYFH